MPCETCQHAAAGQTDEVGVRAGGVLEVEPPWDNRNQLCFCCKPSVGAARQVLITQPLL